MGKLMTDKEIKGMVGTEFIYTFSDHGEVPALIAAFDPEIGFTCLATSDEDNHNEDLSSNKDENGNICLIGYDSDELKDQTKRAGLSFTLKCIKHLGSYRAFSSKGFGYGSLSGEATCSFS